MSTINVNMENLSEEERRQLLSLISKANKPKIFCFENMKEGEKFWIVDSAGRVVDRDFSRSFLHESIFSLGSAFPTREAAELEIKRRKLNHELKEFIKNHDSTELDWNNKDQAKFSLCIDTDEDKLFVDANFSICGKEKELFASSERVLKDAIEEIGEERIKKYLFA